MKKLFLYYVFIFLGIGVFSVKKHIMSRVYQQRDKGQKKILLKRFKKLKVGMSEQEYLTAARAFMINFSIMFTDYVVPGVYETGCPRSQIAIM